MTIEELKILDAIRELIDELPRETRQEVEALARQLRDIIEIRGTVGLLALTLVSAEQSFHQSNT